MVITFLKHGFSKIKRVAVLELAIDGFIFLVSNVGMSAIIKQPRFQTSPGTDVQNNWKFLITFNMCLVPLYTYFFRNERYKAVKYYMLENVLKFRNPSGSVTGVLNTSSSDVSLTNEETTESEMPVPTQENAIVDEAQVEDYDIFCLKLTKGLESERLESERLESERLESERLESERLESERLESERLESERLESERLHATQENPVLDKAQMEDSDIFCAKLKKEQESKRQGRVLDKIDLRFIYAVY